MSQEVGRHSIHIKLSLWSTISTWDWRSKQARHGQQCYQVGGFYGKEKGYPQYFCNICGQQHAPSMSSDIFGDLRTPWAALQSQTHKNILTDDYYKKQNVCYDFERRSTITRTLCVDFWSTNLPLQEENKSVLTHKGHAIILIIINSKNQNTLPNWVQRRADLRTVSTVVKSLFSGYCIQYEGSSFQFQEWPIITAYH